MLKTTVQITQRILAYFLVFAFSASVLAQAEVVEAGLDNNQQIVSAESAESAESTASDNSDSNSNDIVLNLYLQLEALQEEVQTLRGLVEEQSYQIKRMQTDSRDRYLDIDNRLSNLSKESLLQEANERTAGIVNTEQTPQFSEPLPQVIEGSESLNSNSVGVQNATQDGAQTALATPNIVNTENEQELYRRALNLLIDDSNYLDSINIFQQYIDVYPTGRYIANAYYWQGEALILVERYNQAKDVFLSVASEYPEHSKAPGALLKLVVTYLNMNNDLLAQETFQNLQAQYPDSRTEIDAAGQYIRDAGL